MKSTGVVVAAVMGICWIVSVGSCSRSTTNKTAVSPYLNLHDSVEYTGQEACISCHANVHATFSHTGMGESWDKATRKKSSASFGSSSAVYDSFRNFWYRAYWIRDSLYMKEFRIHAGDTVYSRTEKISFIVGSGQHTNSHIWMDNGFLYQAPMTFYTQDGIWDLPPGFEDGMNSRWSRTISLECMNCHNMYPEFDGESENRFLNVKTGIECERCHGPGEIHVREKLAGIIVDTAKETDYTIVNPSRLSRELQVELCQRCHLQGISVLQEGRTFFDFKPGMKLNEVMNVFMPRYEGDPPTFIMASHADRMKQSECYKQSQMTCLTCHNPHVSVKETPAAKFNEACNSCHRAPEQSCLLPEASRAAESNHCYKCHMPVSETIDIPHVTVHDHRIARPVSKEEKEAILQFVGLECLTDEHPSALMMARGYLQSYEAFAPRPFLLDSAERYLNSSEEKKLFAWKKEKIRLHFLREEHGQVVVLAGELEAGSLNDAWTCYRIGESFFQTGRNAGAAGYFRRAAELQPKNMEFLNKYGAALVDLSDFEEAAAVFVRCCSLSSKHAPSFNNLGYVRLLQGYSAEAEKLILRALSLDPDYESAWMNLAAVQISEGRMKEARKSLQRVLSINPANRKAQISLKKIT